MTLILAFGEDQEKLTDILFYSWTPWALMDAFIELMGMKFLWTVPGIQYDEFIYSCVKNNNFMCNNAFGNYGNLWAHFKEEEAEA